MNTEMKKAVDFLYATPKFTTKNSLDHTRELMKILGNPCADRKVIHVAGSNGKGSVCCFLYHMLLSGGKSAALFTSPHLVDVRERFQVNGELISEEEFLEAYKEVKAAADELVRNNRNHPTFFEFIFAMGMVMFDKAQAEYVILETGLGGRLDATNSFPTPVLSVITSISPEHTEILGDTITQIAGEKAGIIKPGVPVVFDANDPEAGRVIRKRAKELGTSCTGISNKMYHFCEIKNNYIDFSLSTDYDKKTKWRIPFSAAYQVENAAVAVTAMRVLNQFAKYTVNAVDGKKTEGPGKTVVVDENAMREGLLRAVWPGRMQEVMPDIYFDGAHNVSGISAFVEAAQRLTADDAWPPLLLFSMVKEKDYHASVDLLASGIVWDAMAVTTIPDERGISFEKLQKLFEEDTDRPVMGFADYREALAVMRGRKKNGQKLFCTGSLYFIGALMEALQQ